MTLKQLEQYISICNEIKIWRKALDKKWDKAGGVVKDTVLGSSTEYPYTAHPVTITGTPAPKNKLRREEERYQKRVERCEAMKQEIEDFVNGLDDSQLRQIIHCRYIEGCSWVKTARMIGGGNSADAVKKRIYRHFKLTA